MSIRIDASSDYMIRTANVPAQNTVSVAFWMYLVSDRNAPGSFLIISDGVATGNFLGLESDGTTLHLARVGATDLTGSSLSISTWYHIGYTRDSSNLTTVYLNGVQDMQETRANAFTSAAMTLGSDTVYWINGRLACIKVWDAALTQAEIQAEMYTIRPARFANLNLWTPGFPGATERGLDYSGNGRNWTQNGTLTDEDPPPVSWGAGIAWESFASAPNAYTLTAAQASFTLTGNATGLRAARLLTATQQAYTLTGQAAALKFGHLLQAAQQSYALSGQAATLTAQRKLTATQQSYTLTGQTAALRAARLISAIQQTYTLTGVAASLIYTPIGGYTLVADYAAFALAGQTVTLRAARLLTAAQQAYALTGQAASLLAARRLALAQASFALTGQAAGLYRGRLLTAAQQTYTLAGQAAALRAARLLALIQASYALTGNAAGLYRGRLLTADQGAYALTGEPASITTQRLIVAAIVEYLLTGQAAALNYSNAPQPTYGSVSGQAVDRLRARIATRLRGQNTDRTR